MLGQKIAQLEARKRAAVEKEDYDTAKLLKVRAAELVAMVILLSPLCSLRGLALVVGVWRVAYVCCSVAGAQADIEKLRSAGEGAAMAPSAGADAAAAGILCAASNVRQQS